MTATPAARPIPAPDFARPAQVLGVLAGAIALAVIFGWHTQNTFLIQLRPDLVPLPYNSALLMLLASVTLILLSRNWIAVPRLLAGGALLLAAVTMGQYFTGIDAGIDQLLMQHYITVQTVYPGRMATSTAFCYLMLNSGFLLFTLHSKLLRSVATVCAAIAIASVIATVIGYEADLQPLFGWSATTYMALHSALGIFLLGLGLFVISSTTANADDDVEANHTLIATAGFIVIVTATLLLWSGLTRQRDEQMRTGLEADLRWLSISLNALYQERATTIERMSRRWEVSGGTMQMVWEEDAASYVETLDGIQAVYRVDPAGVVQWSVPDQGGSLTPGTDVLALAELASTFDAARASGATSYSRPYQRGDDAEHFLMIRPLTVNGMHDGFIVADFNTDTLFGLVQARDPGVPFRVHYAGTPIYSSPMAEDLVSSAERIAVAPLLVAGQGWELEAFPAVPNDLRSRLPNVVLVAGILLALLLVAVLHLWGLSRRALVKADRANAELVRSERQLHRFRTTLDRTLDCVFMFDAQSFQFFYGNAGALRMTGLSYEQLLQKHAWDMNPERTEESFRELVAPLLNHEQDSLTFDSVIGHVNGTTTPVECFIQYIAPLNEPARFVAIVRDITQRKRVEQMKSEFVSTVSHELRTPLTSITGALGLIAGGALGEVPAPAMDMINIAHSNSRRLTHLINDLLDIEKIAAGKVVFDMQVQPLLPLVEQALEATRTYGSESNVTLRLVKTAAVDVRVDSQRLLQIFSNLLSNAIKFSPQGGTVEIAVEHRAPKVRISVRDHGRGIPEEFRGRIFQKFAQADASDTRKQSGTGLGLAISRELAERMNGQLDYDSVVGAGACFYLELPVANEELLVDGGAKTPILIVEDDADAALLLRRMLDDAGYSADIAGHGAAALQALEEKRYAAVVLDLLLPDINGIEIIRRLRERPVTRDLPIIVASAQTENGKLTINGDVPGIVWMPKPVDQGMFLKELRELIARSKRPCRILHIEDDADLHRVIRTMAGDACLFAHAADMKDARALLKPDAFDVVILDIGLPDGSGWDLLPDIRSVLPDSRLVILTGQDTSQLDLRKVDSVLLKSRMTPRELLEAIQAAELRPPSAPSDK